jgi:hypothetical protein
MWQSPAEIKIHTGNMAPKCLNYSCASPYQKGIKVTAAEIAALNIERDAFHPEWNYTIAPRTTLNN